MTKDSHRSLLARQSVPQGTALLWLKSNRLKLDWSAQRV